MTAAEPEAGGRRAGPGHGSVAVAAVLAEDHMQDTWRRPNSPRPLRASASLSKLTDHTMSGTFHWARREFLHRFAHWFAGGVGLWGSKLLIDPVVEKLKLN